MYGEDGARLGERLSGPPGVIWVAAIDDGLAGGITIPPIGIGMPGATMGEGPSCGERASIPGPGPNPKWGPPGGIPGLTGEAIPPSGGGPKPGTTPG